MITSEEFREASSLGKEMIDGERALQDVAVSVSRASGVKSVAATAPTKNPLGRIPCFFVETNNKYQKETDFTSETLSSFSTNIGSPL